MRVYTYARYSTDRQTEASIVDQQRRCHEYAASRSWSVVADFTDEGISGAALGNRPGLQQVMSKLQASDVLLAADLTRLSRSQELAPLLDRVCASGVYASSACWTGSTVTVRRLGCRQDCRASCLMSCVPAYECEHTRRSKCERWRGARLAAKCMAMTAAVS